MNKIVKNFMFRDDWIGILRNNLVNIFIVYFIWNSYYSNFFDFLNGNGFMGGLPSFIFSFLLGILLIWIFPIIIKKKHKKINDFFFFFLSYFSVILFYHLYKFRNFYPFENIKEFIFYFLFFIFLFSIISLINTFLLHKFKK